MPQAEMIPGKGGALLKILRMRWALWLALSDLQLSVQEQGRRVRARGKLL